MFVVDLNKEHIAVAEAKSLGIPVVGIADTNVDPEAIDFPIPGNDDALRSIRLFAAGIADAVLSGRGLAEAASAPEAAETKSRAHAAPATTTATLYPH